MSIFLRRARRSVETLSMPLNFDLAYCFFERYEIFIVECDRSIERNMIEEYFSL